MKLLEVVMVQKIFCTLVETYVYYFLKPGWFLQNDFMKKALQMKPGWFLHIDFMRITLLMKAG